MKLWIKILAGAIPGSVLLSIFFTFVCYRRRKQHRQQQQQQQFIANQQFSEPDSTFQSAIEKLHLSHKSNSKSSLGFHQLHHQHFQNQENLDQIPIFNWENHPRLISEAAENGWSRFVFSSRPTVPKTSPMWGFCAVCDGGKPQEIGEISWEVPSGSLEYMQTIRINPMGTKKNGSTNSTNNSPIRVMDESSSSCVRMNLPLPGPPLIGFSFPQEAYFEITILYMQPMTRASRASKRSKDGAAVNGDDDRTKLIDENFDGGQSNAGDDGEGKKSSSPLQDVKLASGEGKNRSFMVSLGLTRGSTPLTKAMPGTYPGSIGFHSNGCVYLDGMKLVSESEKTDWASVNRVIGCGFNPSKKKVFFTVDSELVHMIRCNSDSYKNPLYPILSSNLDIMFLINLGQAAFKYAPANAHRTPNPCFIRSSPSRNAGSVIGYEDSRELFSMGRIDLEWRDENKKSKSAGNSRVISSKSSRRSSGNWEDASVVVDIDGESDLFEISLQK